MRDSQLVTPPPRQGGVLDKTLTTGFARRYVVRGIVWAVLCGVTLEVCARVDDWAHDGVPFLAVYNSESLYMWDELGKTGKPNARFAKWRLNSLGFRGDEIVDGRIRVACVGSSETFGLYERAGGEWPKRLEIELNMRAGRDAYQVVNAAYPGMSIASTLIRLPRILREVDPQVIVVYPSFSSYIWLPWLEPRKHTTPPVPRFELRIAGRLRNLIKDALPAAVQHHLRRLEIHHALGDQQVMERLPGENVERFRADLERLIDAATEDNRKVVLVTHATRFGPEKQPDDDYYLVAWRRSYPIIREEGLLDMEARMNAVIRDLGRSRGLVVVDAAEVMEPGSKYFVEFVHFTDAGAEKLASLVADGLAELNHCTEHSEEGGCDSHARFARK